ncbi:MAG: phenylacetic acid degradation protein PaaN [Phycisphaerales bacterium]|nr:phenylacetic acid degradation protein PaaN [Phycisphaerales bacterium]
MTDSNFFAAHEDTLKGALDAIGSRGFWSAYPEVPSGRVYGETARADGQAAWKARLGKPFELDQGYAIGTVSDESSPWGIETGIEYPRCDLNQVLGASRCAMDAWKRASVEDRAGVCLEILHRLNKRSFEMAFAVMHTTGQGFMMAFQAGGPHAQDRGLEAVAHAYAAMKACPQSATWSKRVSKTETVTLDKTWRIVPRGIAVTIGCSTFPTWNSYPGIFASLMTGNSVVVKPHPGATLPLALTVEIARDVLAEAGFDRDVVTLVCDSHDAPVAQDLVVHDDVAIVDYTGGNAFGDWVEANATQARVYSEKAGINSVVLDGCDDVRAVTGNLAFSLCLYSGQMCTTPQNIFIPEDGIDTPDGRMSFDDACAAIVKAVDWFLSDPARANEVLGAVQSPATLERQASARTAGGTVLRDGAPVAHEHFPDARLASPLIVQVEEADAALHEQECFGPVVYIVRTASSARSIELAADGAKRKGGLTAALWTRDDALIDTAIDAFTHAGVALSVNLTGQIWVNQSAAFSDYHVSGANPAGNATLCDAAFVADRFRLVATRIPVPAPVEEAAC